MRKLLIALVVFMMSMSAFAEGLTGGYFGLYGGKRFFDSDKDLNDAGEFGLMGGYFCPTMDKLAAEGSLGFISSEDSQNNTDREFFVMTLGVAKYFDVPVKDLYPFIGAGAEFEESIGGYAKAGVRYAYDSNLAFDLGLREDLLSQGRYDTTLYAALSYAFGKEKPVPVEKPKVDSDGDGVYDEMDQCADTPSGWKVDEKGCPFDADKDGVYDEMDKCPDTPAGVKVNADGCPLDTDKDGVYDYLDKCPGTPEGVKVDEKGCALDEDGDMVADYKDKCFPTPEGAIVDNTGCMAPVTIKVKFDTGKSKIKENYYPEIEKFVAYLNALPKIAFIIEGHTDCVGLKSNNQKLSERRANALMKLLATKYGISPSRMQAIGYGEEKPVADNSTKEGKAENRRIEINFQD